ncbi:uncharacterized protein IUM83_19942 [Phytophthora cinnamomi]|uniref:uncharacterized protein n=1 Tax=Phytophthora cinnamomi TaxID=4785 RepID=UPI0035595BB5|nr:hypothetical protein IUM83_19942 [Phytophthora cinnamomi]
MKFFFQAVAAAVMLLASGTDAELYRLSEKFGEPHGTSFSDAGFAIAGQTTGRERTNLFHGGSGGYPKTLGLNSGERFLCLEAHSGKYHGRTRIRYIKITTSSGRSIDGGTPTTKIGKVCAPDGFQLGGFAGSSGDELDQVGAVWVMN